ncbi:uncharacterized protein LOC143079606 [Mytilus galloprovincialis]|uniref:uncharacterized protein LOC143079606 n=1 Tax=Mytilus galloprovincialis TaxID=29158 RepID=UPI003F7B6936
MIAAFISLLVIGSTKGFLLESKNTSTLAGKPTYLTTSEYYEDKNKIHYDLETYRDQQQKSLNLLANQLQQKFDIIEQILAAQPSYNELNKTEKTIDALEQKYKELELKYSAVQAELTVKEQMYNSSVNETLALAEKIKKLEQLKNINQLQTLQKLQAQVQTFDSRINFLTSHEQARNQDFLALYNLTTSSKHELKSQMNNQYQTMQQKQHQDFQILHNLTSDYRKENEKLANHTMKEINELANNTMNEIEQMGRYHNSSFSLFQQNLDKQLQKVVVTGCTNYGYGNKPAGPLKFPVIKTSVGVSNHSNLQANLPVMFLDIITL